MKHYTNVAARGNSILYRGIDNGVRVTKRLPFQPSLFIPANGKQSDWKTIEGDPVSKLQFDNIADAKEFMNSHKDVAGFPVYGMNNWVSQFITEQHPREIDYDINNVRIAFIDIEVWSEDGFPEPKDAEHPITALTVRFSDNPTYYIFGTKDFDESDCIVDDFIYIQSDTELDMMLKFLNWWSSDDVVPDVITGWNTKTFDVPYMVRRLENIMPGAEKKLSPWGVVFESNIRDQNGNEVLAHKILGIEILDYMDLFKKFAYIVGTMEAYSLDFVASFVLGEKKLSYEEQASLHQLYINDYQKYINYNVRDVELVFRLHKEKALIDLVLSTAYKAGCNYTDALGSVAMWDTYIYRELCRRNIVVPPKVQKPSGSIVGGYVKDPMIGAHDWIVSFDLNSLYPHLMLQYNMSPETVMEDILHGTTVDGCLRGVRPDSPSSDIAVAANGAQFRTDKRGIIPEIIDQLYSERKQIKKEMLRLEQEQQSSVNSSDAASIILYGQQMAIKIMMNSLYGCMANKWFRYYDRNVAEGITMSGQLSIRWAEKVANMFVNQKVGTDGVDYVIAIDTDSLYVNMKPIVDQMGLTDTTEIENALDEFCSTKMVPELTKGYDALAGFMNAYSNRMVMEREVIAKRGIWIAKKRYILDVLNSEGVHYTKPKLKMMGVEAVKSSTPAPCREAYKEIFKVILRTNEKKTQEALEAFRTYFESLPVEDISFPRGCSNVNGYADPDTIYRKGTPIQVRGALLYNHHIKRLGLDKQYEMIKDGEKIKFVYLTEPNRIRENVISFPKYLPDEFDIKGEIDYDTQFDKAFLSGLRPILTALNWKEKEENTLESWFG